MAQHSTSALDDQFPLHPQEIRSAALQAASRITARLARDDTDPAAATDVALDLAEKFETYIEYGTPTEVGGAPEDLWVKPGFFPPLDPEKVEAGRRKLMVALGMMTERYMDCSCPQCVEARRLRDEQRGRCDHCDKPYTGGSAGGGLPSQYWCDDHRPDDIGGPGYPADQDAPTPTPLPAIDLVDELAAALARANEERDTTQYPKWRPDAEAALVVFRERLLEMPGGTTVEDVFRSLFGNVGATQ